jgi:hypothetical protein
LDFLQRDAQTDLLWQANKAIPRQKQFLQIHEFAERVRQLAQLVVRQVKPQQVT